MTAAEFKIVVAMAKCDRYPLTMDDYDASAFADGWGLPEYTPMAVSLKCAVAHLRWQCCQFNGGWDDAACAEAWHAWVKRKRFELVDLTEPVIRTIVAEAVLASLEA